MGSKKFNLIGKALLIILGIYILIFYVATQPFKIPSGNMIPTLLVGDRILVNKYSKSVNRGDVVVFKYPNAERGPSKEGVYYINRLVGLPGDQIDIEGRSLFINGEEVPMQFIGTYQDERNGVAFDEYNEDLYGDDHKVIFRKGKENTNTGNYIPVIKVPEGSVFVMGDNRDNSQDSRYWGFVPIENIAGKAFVIHWSWDFDNPDLKDKVRWGRILSGID